MTAATPPNRPISIAVLAMGGQGGGVLADWIVALAEAQRLDGAVDLGAGRRAAHRRDDLLHRDCCRRSDGRAPVLSLMPVPGDVDIVIAAELMEAGPRDPARPGDARPHHADRLDPSRLRGAGKIRARRRHADPAKVQSPPAIAAKRFFGSTWRRWRRTTAASSPRPVRGAGGDRGAAVPARAFEDTIRDAGVGVEASLRAFAPGHERASSSSKHDAASALKTATSHSGSPPGQRLAAGLDRLARARRAAIPSGHA